MEDFSSQLRSRTGKRGLFSEPDWRQRWILKGSNSERLLELAEVKPFLGIADFPNTVLALAKKTIDMVY